jgi:hypothetical protein
MQAGGTMGFRIVSHSAAVIMRKVNNTMPINYPPRLLFIIILFTRNSGLLHIQIIIIMYETILLYRHKHVYYYCCC